MNRIYLVIILICIGLVGLKGQNPLLNSLTVEDPVTTYDPVGGLISISVTNPGPTAFSTAAFSFQLGPGLEVLPATLTPISGPSVSINAGDLNAPIVNVDAVFGVGETVEFSFQQVGGCAARAAKIANEDFTVAVNFSDGGTPIDFSNASADNVIAHDVLYAALSITNLMTTPTQVIEDGVATRMMNITNGSFGALGELMWYEVYPGGLLDYDNFSIINVNTNAAMATTHSFSADGMGNDTQGNRIKI